MKLTLDKGDREILTTNLELAADASDAEIIAAATARLGPNRVTGRRALRSGGDPVGDTERDSTIAAAVRDGKFSADRADHYRRLWDRDPKGTKRAIASLAPGVAQLAAGEVGDDSYPADWLRLPAASGSGSRTHGTGD